MTAMNLYALAFVMVRELRRRRVRRAVSGIIQALLMRDLALASVNDAAAKAAAQMESFAKALDDMEKAERQKFEEIASNYDTPKEKCENE